MLSKAWHELPDRHRLAAGRADTWSRLVGKELAVLLDEQRGTRSDPKRERSRSERPDEEYIVAAPLVRLRTIDFDATPICSALN